MKRVAALTVLALCCAPASAAVVLNYQGAFRVNCPYGGYSIAYNPDGNQGAGSLLMFSPGSGTWFAEYAMDAAPLITSDYTTLNFATTLIAKGAQTWGGGHSPVGMEYYGGRVYGGTHQPGWHGYTDPSGNAEVGYAGPWMLAGVDDRRVGEYLSAIPAAWVAANLAGTEPQGAPPAADRFMSSGYEWASFDNGPDLYAYDPDTPYDHDNNAATAERLPTTILLEYTAANPQNVWISGDKWSGSAWVEVGGQTYFLLTGKKLDGAGGSAATVQVYDAADFAAVAAGTKQPYEPQPIQNISVQSLMFQQVGLSGAALNSATNTLYAVEYSVGGTSPVVHVWTVVPEPAALGLLGLGGCLLLVRKRTRRSTTARD